MGLNIQIKNGKQAITDKIAKKWINSENDVGIGTSALSKKEKKGTKAFNMPYPNAVIGYEKYPKIANMNIQKISQI